MSDLRAGECTLSTPHIRRRKRHCQPIHQSQVPVRHTYVLRPDFAFAWPISALAHTQGRVRHRVRVSIMGSAENSRLSTRKIKSTAGSSTVHGFSARQKLRRTFPAPILLRTGTLAQVVIEVLARGREGTETNIVAHHCRMSCKLSTRCSIKNRTRNSRENVETAVRLDTLAQVQDAVPPKLRSETPRETSADTVAQVQIDVPTGLITFENTSSCTDGFAPVHNEVEITSVPIIAAAQLI